MKIKSAKIIGLSLILSLLLSFGFIFMPQKISTSATEPVTYNTYMLVNGNVEVKEEPTKAGTLSINGSEVDSSKEYKYVVGETDIEISAKANDGYVLVGWYILFTDDSTNYIEGTTNGYIGITNEIQSICDNLLIINTYSVNNKQANLTINEMFENISIAPVYDYQYFSVKMTDASSTYTVGSYKFGDVVNIEKDVEGVNIDATGFEFSNSDIEFTHSFTKDETTGKTTKYQVEFTMSVYSDVEINLTYDNLYQIDFEFFLNSTKLEESQQEFADIFSVLKLTTDKVWDTTEGKYVDKVRYFKKLSDTSYFIKKGSNFELSVSQNINNANGYTIYNFYSLDENRSSLTANYNGISQDKVVKIVFDYKTFKVEYVGVELRSDNSVATNNDLEVSTTVNNLSLINTSLELTSVNNVGYEFLGFAKYEAGKSTYTSADYIENISLNTSKPEDLKVYAIYQKIGYTINLTNLTDVSLINLSGESVYPVASAELNNETKTGTDISFSTFYIGDVLTLTLSLNNGFDVTNVTGMTKQDENKQIYTLVLDKNFLNGKTTSIDLSVVASKQNYSLTYRIDALEDDKKMADIVVLDKNITATKSEDNKYYEIVVENLNYYDKVTLKSTALGTETDGEYYMFKWFTTDFKTTLSGVVSDENTPETNSVDFVIYRDSVVYVVYTNPTTQLKIEINSAPDDAGISFEVSQTSTGILEAVNELYQLTQSELVTITISNLTSNEKLFGYNFVNIELYTLKGETRTKVTGAESTSTTSYTFTPTSSDVYIVVINIDKINYVFNITSNLSFSTTKTLTVEDSLIEFEKPVGYYVGGVQIQKIGGGYLDRSNMIQDNDSRNGTVVVDGKNMFSIYSYNISTVGIGGQSSEFEYIISNCGILVGSEIQVNIELTFNIYTYEVRLKYYKFYNNQNNTATGLKLTYPTVKLTYSLEDGTTDVAREEYLSEEIIYKSIPYNADATLKVVQTASYGFTMIGWYDYGCVNQKSSLNVDETEKLYKFNLFNITNDDSLAYRVNFDEYQIKLSYDDSQGNAYVNNVGSDRANIKMSDVVRIEANASVEKGFIAKSIKTTKLVYTLYEYTTDEQFELDAENLVIIKNGYRFSLIGNEYDADYSYYIISTEEYVVNASSFVENSFDVGLYFALDGVITFEIEYAPVEMTIENITRLIAKTGEGGVIVCDKFDTDKVGLTEDQIANYTIKAKRGGSYRDIVENESIVTVDDIIYVDIQINQSAISTNGKTFNLAQGLELYSYPLFNNWIDLEFKNNGNGSYQISFVVSKNIRMSYVDNGKITIDYSFQQKEMRTVSVTTNMASSTNFTSATELGITIDGNETNNNTGSISKKGNFLANVIVDIDLKTLSDYFVVNSITAYKNGISSSNIITDLDSYFIKDNKIEDATGRRVISNVELILTGDDIIIQLNVQPRLYIEGNEITTQSSYQINRTYKIDSDGNGVAQTFTLGSNAKTCDIAGYQIDADSVKVVVYKNGIKQSNGAIDVGEYTLKLALIDEDDSDSWLYYISELPFIIKVNVSALPITLIAKVNDTIVKTYRASSSYADFELVKDNGKLISSDGAIEIVGMANQQEFNLGVLNFDYGYKRATQIVAYGEDGLVSQKDVTNSAHIFVTNLKLINNPNFTLMLNNYVLNSQEVTGLLIENCIKIEPRVIFIRNLAVYDKVWDGNSEASFGLTEGATKYILEQTYTDDNVYLIPENLKVYFVTKKITKTEELDNIKTSEIGENLYVVIDARTALGGNGKSNYVIGDVGTNTINYNRQNVVNYTSASIYPYTISTTIKGIGNITITNKRGLTDHTKANLIPVYSTLSVERFGVDSAEYREIYGNISSFLSRRNVFVAGYQISLIDRNGTKTSLSNDLYLTLPSEDELKQVLSLSGDRAVDINYDEKGGNIEIDLKQINEDISYFVLIQNRALLKAWQIVLISVGSAVVLAGSGVAVFFIVRKRKLKNDRYDTI